MFFPKPSLFSGWLHQRNSFHQNCVFMDRRQQPQEALVSSKINKGKQTKTPPASPPLFRILSWVGFLVTYCARATFSLRQLRLLSLQQLCGPSAIWMESSQAEAGQGVYRLFHLANTGQTH